MSGISGLAYTAHWPAIWPILMSSSFFPTFTFRFTRSWSAAAGREYASWMSRLPLKKTDSVSSLPSASGSLNAVSDSNSWYRYTTASFRVRGNSFWRSRTVPRRKSVYGFHPNFAPRLPVYVAFRSTAFSGG